MMRGLRDDIDKSAKESKDYQMLANHALHLCVWLGQVLIDKDIVTLEDLKKYDYLTWE